LAAEIWEVFSYFLFETFVLFSSIRLTFFILNYRNKKVSTVESFILWLSLSIIISILITTLFSFIAYNGAIQYVLTAGILLLILHLNKKSELQDYWNYLLISFKKISKVILSPIPLVLISLTIPLFLIALRPVFETDSLFILNFLIDLMFNNTSPYGERAWYYIPAWEFAYLPSLVITHSDTFFWLNSIKPVLILFFVTYLIGRQIKLPSNLSLITSFGTVLFYKIWISTPAISFLKNDLLFGAGIVMISLATIRSINYGFNRLNLIFLIVGITFVTVKYPGVFIGIFAIFLFFLFNKDKIIKTNRTKLLWIPISLTIIFLVTGHYYFNNYLEFENPLHPHTLPIISPKSPSSETSILANLDQQQLWEIFFPPEISRAGLFFHVFLAVGVGGTISIIIYFILKFFKKKEFDSKIVYLSVYILFTWIVYSATTWSAGTLSDDLSRIDNLESLRYVFGTIFLTELFFIFILYKIKTPTKILYILIGINIVTRLSFLYDRFTYDYSFIVFPIAILIGLYVLNRYSKKISRISLITAIVIALFVFAPQIIEENRDRWMPPWNEVVFQLYELPPSEIFVLDDPNDKDIWARTYPVYGRDFQHSVLIGTSTNLIEKILDDTSPPPDYVAIFCKPSYIECKTKLDGFANEFEFYGYTISAIDEAAILMKFSK